MPGMSSSDLAVLEPAPDEDPDSPGTGATTTDPARTDAVRRTREHLLGPTLLDRYRGWPATLTLTLLAGFLRLWHLATPAGTIFDEVYYAKDAHDLLTRGVEQNATNDGPGFVVHPPLGKWAIAGGEALFGNSEFGWRFAAAVAGTLSVLVMVRVARRMTGSTLLGVVAGLLLTFDALHFVQSRVAMLDVFLMFWVLAGFGCLVADRDLGRRRLAAAVDDGRVAALWGPRLGVRWWRIAGGVCLGAALATKWSALYFIAVFGLLALAWEIGSRRTAGVRRPAAAALWRESSGLALALLAVPVVVYLASWTGWFVTDSGWDRDWAAANPGTALVPDALRSLWHYHVQMLSFHNGLSTPHRYQSHPQGWLLLARPVAYYYESASLGQMGCDAAAGCSRAVLGIGSPAVWWTSILALFGVAWLWVSHRDWRAAAVLASAAAGILPWLVSDHEGRTMFLFYALPSLPFLVLAITLCAGWALGGPGASVLRRRNGAVALGVLVGLVVLNFFYLYPILTAQTIPYVDWSSRMWFGSWI